MLFTIGCVMLMRFSGSCRARVTDVIRGRVAAMVSLVGGSMLSMLICHVHAHSHPRRRTRIQGGCQ
jgi:hypothetical protein